MEDLRGEGKPRKRKTSWMRLSFELGFGRVLRSRCINTRGENRCWKYRREYVPIQMKDRGRDLLYPSVMSYQRLGAKYECGNYLSTTPPPFCFLD